MPRACVPSSVPSSSATLRNRLSLSGWGFITLSPVQAHFPNSHRSIIHTPISVTPPVTFTCVPVGEGSRLAIDRDGDGYADWDEKTAGTNPADAASHP